MESKPGPVNHVIPLPLPHSGFHIVSWRKLVVRERAFLDQVQGDVPRYDYAPVEVCLDARTLTIPRDV
jgi:hypothetical protein